MAPKHCRDGGDLSEVTLFISLLALYASHYFLVIIIPMLVPNVFVIIYCRLNAG